MLTGIESGIDATGLVVALEAVAAVVKLHLLKRATVEVLLRGLEVFLRHFQPARTRVVTMVVARVALTEKSPGSERSKVRAPPILSRNVLTSLKIAQVQMTIHPTAHLSVLRSTVIPALAWARFKRSLDVTEEDLDVTETKIS